MAVQVPAQYVALLQAAAKVTGIPYAVVAAQINEESGFNPDAVSPTGAQGIAQFEPGTWATQGTGSPFNAADAMKAYAKYMGSLLVQEHGNLRNALAAYNAGPGNLQAGYGYADTILKAAGQSPTTINTTSSSSSGGTTSPDWWNVSDPALGFLGGSLVKGFTGTATGVGDVATSLGGLATEFGTMFHWMSFLFAPSNWLRFGAAWIGVSVFIVAMIILAKAAETSDG